MDVSMPVMNGLEATKIILKTIPDSKIIILTVHNEEEYITEFIRVGAKGYILKVVPFEELVEAIKLINHGDEYFNFKVSKEGI
jgi:two-component system response regulator DegU